MQTRITPNTGTFYAVKVPRIKVETAVAYQILVTYKGGLYFSQQREFFGHDYLCQKNLTKNT